MRSTRELVYQSPAHFNLSEELNSARKQGLFCDTRLVASDKNILAHRVVLNIASPYFHDILASKEGNKTEIELDDIDGESLETVVQFLYTGAIRVSYANIRNVISVSTKLGLIDLTEACLSYLAGEILPEDSLELRIFSAEHCLWQLCERVDSYLKENFQEVYQRKDFLLLPRMQITLMTSNNCTIDQLIDSEVLYEKVVEWVRKRVEDHGEQLSNLLEERNMLYLQADNLLKDCALEDVDEFIDIDSNENIRAFKSQTSRTKATEEEIMVHRNVVTPTKKKQTLNMSNEYKVIMAINTSDHNYIGLSVLAGRLIAVALHLKWRQMSSSASTVSSESSGCEDLMNVSLTMLSPMTTGRCSGGVASLNDKLYVIGGYNRGNCLSSCEFYDAEINEWTAVPNLGVSRARLQATAVGNFIYAAGGSDGHRDLNTVEVYDSKKENWRTLKPMFDGRTCFGMVSHETKIYAIGGIFDSRSIKSAEVFDIKTEEWTRLPPLTVPRGDVCVVECNGNVYAIGGRDGWMCHSSIEMFDPVSSTWSNVANMSGPRRGAAAALLNGKIIVAGGTDGRNALNSVECFDLETNTCHQIASMTTHRNSACMAVINNTLFVVGGFGGYTGTEFLNTIEFYNTATNDWAVYIQG